MGFQQFVFVEVAGGHEFALVEGSIIALGGGKGGLCHGSLPEPLPGDGHDAE